MCSPGMMNSRAFYCVALFDLELFGWFCGVNGFFCDDYQIAGTKNFEDLRFGKSYLKVG